MAVVRGGAILARCSGSSSSSITAASAPMLPLSRRPSLSSRALQQSWHCRPLLEAANASPFFKEKFDLLKSEGLGFGLKPRPRKFGRWRASNYSTASLRAAPGNGRRPSSSSRSPPRPRNPPASQDVEESRSSVRGEEVPLERFFASCPPGLEEIVAAELRSAAIGAARVQIGSAGVSFQGAKRIGVLANLWLRSATRVLLELASGPLQTRVTRASRDPVYEFVRRAADWPLLLVDESDVGPTKWSKLGLEGQSGINSGISSGKNSRVQLPPLRSGRDVEKIARNGEGGRRAQSQKWKFRTFSVSSRVRDCEGVTSSMFASTRAKDAVCDALKDSCGGCRPDPPEDGSASADVPLFLSLYRDHAVLYRDMTGVSLHKRGYRDVMHKAGLNEAIAAAMLSLAGWNRGLPEFESANKGGAGMDSGVLMDPMCGSGTLLIEAALMAVNSAPGLARSRWPFESWHDFHPSLLKSCREDAIAAEISAPKGLRLLGNDIHDGALSLCKRGADAANVRSMLELSCKDCRDYSPPVTPSLVVVNPPWGARLGDSSGQDHDQSLLTTWQALGRFLKTHCSQADVYVLSGNSSVTHAMHMKADKKWPVSVGGVDCRIMHYHVLPPKTSRTLESSVQVPNLT